METPESEDVNLNLPVILQSEKLPDENRVSEEPSDEQVLEKENRIAAFQELIHLCKELRALIQAGGDQTTLRRLRLEVSGRLSTIWSTYSDELSWREKDLLKVGRKLLDATAAITEDVFDAKPDYDCGVIGIGEELSHDIEAEFFKTVESNSRWDRKLLRSWRQHATLRAGVSASLAVAGALAGGFDVSQGATTLSTIVFDGIKVVRSGIATVAGMEAGGAINAVRELKSVKQFDDFLNEKKNFDELAGVADKMSLEEVLSSIGSLTSVISEQGTIIQQDTIDKERKALKQRQEKYPNLVKDLRNQYEQLSLGKKIAIGLTVPILALAAAAGGLYVGTSLSAAYVGIGAASFAISLLKRPDERPLRQAELALELKKYVKDRAEKEGMLNQDVKAFSDYKNEADARAKTAKTAGFLIAGCIQVAENLLHGDTFLEAREKAETTSVHSHTDLAHAISPNEGKSLNPEGHGEYLGGVVHPISHEVAHEPLHPREEVPTTAGHHIPEKALPPEIKVKKSLGEHITHLARRVTGTHHHEMHHPVHHGSKDGVLLHLGTDVIPDHGTKTQHDVATWIVKGELGKDTVLDNNGNKEHVYLSHHGEELAIKDVEKQIQSHFNADGTLKPHQDLVHTLDGQKVGHDAITNIRETWEKLHPHSGVGASHVHGMSGMGYASDIHNHATSSPSEIAPIAGVHNPELIPGAPEAAPGEIPINPDNSPVPDSLHQGGDPYAPVPDTILTPDQLHQGGDNSLPSITPDQIGIDSAPVPDALTTSITPPDLHFLQQDLHSQFILADQHVTPGQESSSLDFDTRTHVDKAVEAYATHMLQTGDSQSTLTHISKVAKAVGLGDQGIFSLAYTDEQSALSDSGLRSFTTNPAAADLLLSRLDIVRTSVQNSYVVAA